MVVMDRVNANLGLENSGRWSLYTGGLYIQLNYSKKCIGRTRRRSLYAGGLFMQVVFSTGSTVYIHQNCLNMSYVIIPQHCLTDMDYQEKQTSHR